MANKEASNKKEYEKEKNLENTESMKEHLQENESDVQEPPGLVVEADVTIKCGVWTDAISPRNGGTYLVP